MSGSPRALRYLDDQAEFFDKDNLAVGPRLNRVGILRVFHACRRLPERW